MKKLLYSLALTAVFAVSAMADTAWWDLGVTNTWAANATNTTMGAAGCGNTNSAASCATVAIQLTASPSATAAAGTIGLTFASSLDGTNFSTLTTVTTNIGPFGTAGTRFSHILNLDLGNARYFKLTKIDNTNATSALTNVIMRAGVKTIKSAP